MSSYNIFKRNNYLKISKESILKPKNKKINLHSQLNNKVNLVNNIHRFDKDKYKRMNPKYKKFFKNIINSELEPNEKTENIKLYDSNSLKQSKDSNKKIIKKNNSFLSNSSQKAKKDILLELEQLKLKIKLKRKKIYSYSFKNEKIKLNKNSRNNTLLNK